MMFYSPKEIIGMEKAWLYKRMFSEVVIVTGKNKRTQYKRYNVNQN